MNTRALLAYLVFFLPVSAAADPIPVDLELAFVVDASGSIDEAETELQRRGYAEALAHPRIQKAISAGFLGRIGVAFIEFAAYDCERLSVPWTVIDGPEAAAAFGRKLLAVPYVPCLGGNAVADALAFAADTMDTNNLQGTRRVIDISGDGPNTMGMSLRGIRRDILSREITINALVLERPEMPDLPEYFRQEVVGGPGAFMVEARNYGSFAAAILKKMLSEIVSAPGPDLAGPFGDQKVAYTAKHRYDFVFGH